MEFTVIAKTEMRVCFVIVHSLFIFVVFSCFYFYFYFSFIYLFIYLFIFVLFFAASGRLCSVCLVGEAFPGIITYIFVSLLITKTSLFKYIESFTSKNWKISDKKNSDIFYISAQNIECGYSLEPPRQGGSNEYPQFMFWADIRKTTYTPVNPSFTI